MGLIGVSNIEEVGLIGVSHIEEVGFLYAYTRRAVHDWHLVVWTYSNSNSGV
jgi:hypothetical protein